jgi:iron complex transport system permease protein
MNSQPKTRLTIFSVVLVLASVLLLIAGTSVGSVGFEAIWFDLTSVPTDPNSAASQAVAQQIVWDIRLPRSLGAWAAGALLGLAGALAQGLFRNPLADPYLLGSASGAALGVALCLALLGGATAFGDYWIVRLGLSGAAFVGAVLAVLLTLVMARGVEQTLRLLLAGVVVGVVLGAATSLVLLYSPDSLQAMQAFMLGSTGFVGWSACLLMLFVWVLCCAIAWAFSPTLDALTLGESTAASLGLPIPAVRISLIVLLAFATGTAVAQTGLIAFVGLAAPHLVRGVVRVRYGALLWLASLAGGVLLAAADLLARWLIAPQELPVGILTAVLGGSYLLWVMHTRQSIKGQGNG